MWLDIGVGLLVTIIFFLATFVLVRSRGPVNGTFALFAYLIATWIIANYIGANFKMHPVSRYFVHADFFLGTLVAYTFWYFTATLLQQTKPPGVLSELRHRLRLPLLLVTVVGMVTSLLPWAIRIATPAHRPIAIDYETGFVLYAAILGGLLSWGIVNIGLTLRFARDAFQRQVFTISRGLVAGVVLVALANLILPELTTAKSLNLIAGNASYLGIVAFIASTFYAIARHRLFDLRFFVVRTVAYMATLAVLAGIFGVIVFGLSSLVIDLHIKAWEQVYISTATALAALGFSGLKGFFDKISNSLFYRDAYDTQELLDTLNRSFVANADLVRLLRDSAEAIQNSLKAEFCFFGIRDSEHTPQRVVGKGVRTIKPEDIQIVRQVTPHIHHKLIVTEELSEGHEQLKTVLRGYDIAVLGRLTPTVNRTVEGMGYLVLGPRRSGNPYTPKDLRVIEIIVNELVIAIENSLRFEQIQNFNETLQENVEDATRKLRRTNDKLQALDATKDEFITMASHQLRTPLTSVKGYLSMVLEGDAGKLNAQQTELLTQSYISAQRMVYLIADLLNLSRLSTGKFVIEPTPTDLGEVVQGEIDQLRETAKSRDINLTFDRPATLPKLMLDETKIHQVVMNFIDNAIYYTPSGGSIKVRLRETPAYVEYTVTDNGMGVPKAEQHKLFTKFYRAGNARKARPDGTGLGLFMAKKVIAAQGGAIVFESVEGKGSTFGFRFNKSEHMASAPPTEPALEPAQA